MPKLTSILLATALVASSMPAAAQDWPTRPVTIVVPYGPGSGADVLGRILAPRMSELLGQSVIIENVAGAGGMIGSARIAKAQPDGYLSVIGTAGTHAQKSVSHQEAVLSAIGFFAGGDDRGSAVRADHAQGPAGGEFAAVHRLREGEPGQTEIRLARHRVRWTSGVRVAQQCDRRRRHTHSLSRRRAGDDRPDQRRDRLSVRGRCGRSFSARRQDDQADRIACARAARRSCRASRRAPSRACRISTPRPGMRCSCRRPRRRRSCRSSMPRQSAPCRLRSVRDRLRSIGAEPPTGERTSVDYMVKLVESDVKKWAAPIRAAKISVD